VNVTEVPVQIVVPGLAAILTDGVSEVVVVIVKVFEFTGVVLAQAAFDVICTVTWSLFTSEALV
jgi:hypothetical protein